jgi:hypothetical protein
VECKPLVIGAAVTTRGPATLSAAVAAYYARRLHEFAEAVKTRNRPAKDDDADSDDEEDSDGDDADDKYDDEKEDYVDVVDVVDVSSGGGRGGVGGSSSGGRAWRVLLATSSDAL